MTEHIQPNMKGLLLKSLAIIAFAAGLSDAGTTASSVTPSTLEGTSVTPMMDINKTVLEVEKILDKYPELPRIERSEILSILQNITEEDNEKLKDELAGVLEEEKQKMQKKAEEKPVETKEKNRSVMVVLPFQADDTEESLEELFTRSPIVRMEEQKDVIMRVSTVTPSTAFYSTGAPSFSIIEKEDKKFNPPLRIIGYRYDTTPPPSQTSTSKTYVNYQNPEQVTMAFRSHEVKTGSQWNHKDDNTDTIPKIVLNEDLKSDWDSEPIPTGPKTSFHVPENVDNFSLEDAMVSEGEDNYNPPTTTIRISDISLTTEEPTTERMYITPMTSKQEIVSSTTTTEKDFTTTTPGSYKKKYKTKPKVEKKKVPRPDNLASVVDTLPLDMKAMLSNLGLDSKSITSTTTTEQPKTTLILSLNPEIDPSSYFKFKPLPLKRQKTISDDMQEFLASFGLLDGLRQQKAVIEETTPLNDKFLEKTPEINTDILSESMKKTLDSLGLYEKASTKHIFNPSNHSTVQTEEEIQKLNALLSTIKKLASLNDSEPVTPEFQQEILQQVKELDNITTSYKTSAAINEEIHKIMDRNKGKFKIPLILHESAASGNLKKGPEPEFFEEIQLKNEVKRQENSSTTTAEPEASSTTEEPSNSPDLEGAFGGGETAAAGSDPAESLPPRRPNGLYLLLDWNTFFEVGTDDDARRVNIRFQPKVGDGRNFLPVTIP